VIENVNKLSAIESLRMLKTVGLVLAGIIVVPIIFVFSFVFMIIWLVFTVTGLGPLLQWYYNQRDKEILNIESLLSQHKDLRMVTVPAGVNSASGGKPYRMCIRYTEAASSTTGTTTTAKAR
jgi:hypothetical protein